MKTNTEVATQIIKVAKSGDSAINILEYAETVLDAWRIEIEGRKIVGKESTPCPCCNQLFQIERTIMGSFHVWCGGSAPCTSYLANNGAMGDTVEEAIKKLLDILERKKDWK